MRCLATNIVTYGGSLLRELRQFSLQLLLVEVEPCLDRLLALLDDVELVLDFAQCFEPNPRFVASAHGGVTTFLAGDTLLVDCNTALHVGLPLRIA